MIIDTDRNPARAIAPHRPRGRRKIGGSDAGENREMPTHRPIDPYLPTVDRDDRGVWVIEDANAQKSRGCRSTTRSIRISRPSIVIR